MAVLGVTKVGWHDWDEWFKGDSSQEAKRKFKESEQIDIPVVDKDVTRELIRITKCNIAANEKELRQGLEQLSLTELQAYVAQEKANLEQEEAAWKEKRRKGLKRITTEFQSFAETFERFLKGYSGVVEVAQLADNVYGGAATAALTILFATAKLKSANDQSIQSAMGQIADRLPDFNIYQRIYADNELAVMLATAFTDVIVFAREATIYLQSHGAMRVIVSLAKPLRFQGLQDQMLVNFRRIRVKCDTLLAQRVASLAETNADLLNELNEVKSELKEAKVEIQGLHARKDDDSAKALNRFLGREVSDSKSVRATRLINNRNFLSNLFDEVKEDFSTMTLQDIMQTVKYQLWQQTESSLFILHGRNGVGLEQKYSQSWLSPCALDLVDHLRASGNGYIVAYPKCVPELTLEDVLKDIISEITDLDRQILRRGSDVQNIKENVGHGLIKGAAKALLTVVNRCHSPVYIIIDRPETCRRGNRGDMWLLVKEMFAIVKGATNQLRILMVLKTDVWDISERISDFDQRDQKSGKLVVLRRNQHEL
ncbi:uncharacterized protein F4807DRAFT_445262 [Annulohypoxylon truncatum]|uniref:uncharacterized protein n=1 Tax=Annulohypoxylon truncatum TaxID=327061 RepID=UPI002008639C|nr:uncharacterized protein F4807DRAFT_445262 [Annulohypoxylon truncatum]KAI1204852.1 hypothetical protein F4807DRAFT_445262 [Annulohypoxylon truncatum]